jgi:ribosomal protein L44E
MEKMSFKKYKKRHKKKYNTKKQNKRRRHTINKTIKNHNRTKQHAKNKTIKKTFIKLNCSPENKNRDYTCYSDIDLYKLRDMWNARHPDRPIYTKNSKTIWYKLKEYYATICNKESCWVRQMTKNTKLEKELLDAFAPESPKDWEKNPNEWLSSIDILQVMNQYEKKYKCFDFLGPSPIDYDTHKLNDKCVWEELCHFKLFEQIKKGHTKIGIIFNLDPHYKGGSHWVSLFINVKEKTIFFFDSAGEPIPPQIEKFVNTVIEQGKLLYTPIHFKFDQNYPVEHQYGNTECGIYSLFFIIYMLEDKISGDYLKTHIIKDKYMENFRDVFYNKNGDV